MNSYSLAPSVTASRKFLIRSALFMSGYLAVNAGAMTGAFDGMKTPGAWAFALVAAAPVIGQIVALLVYMRDSDEFVRGLAARRFIIAAGVTLALAAAWGFMELHAGAPHVSAAVIFPVFCAAFGLAIPLVRSTTR